MKPNQMFDILDIARRARANGDIFNPLFVSPPGLGKTEISQQWAKKEGLDFIVMNLASYDAPDFKGFPHIQNINGKQRLSFATPDTFPDAGEGVIILEELNRSPTSIMQCILSLADSRRGFDGYTLPSGWIVVGCINPEEGYDTNTMDEALKDRFEMFNVSYDKVGFLSYIKEANWHKDISNFIESGTWTYQAPEDIKGASGSKYVSCRTFSKLNAAKKAGFKVDDEIMIYNTILGNNIGKDFYNFIHNESPVFLSDLHNNLKPSLNKLKKFSDPANFKSGMISMTIKDILEDNKIEDKLLVEVLRVIPADQGYSLVHDLEFKRNEKSGTVIKRMFVAYPDLKKQFKDVVQYGK